MKNNKKKVSYKINGVHKKYKGIKIKERIMAFVLAASMGIEGTGISMKRFFQDEVVISKVMENFVDNVPAGIPLYVDNMEQILIPNDSIVIMDDKIYKNPDDMVSIIAISEKGEQVSGKTFFKYLNMLKKISKDELNQYNIIYTVSAKDSIVIRSSTSVDSDEIGKILPNEQVLGMRKNIESEKNGLWKSILYINDTDIKKRLCF